MTSNNQTSEPTPILSASELGIDPETLWQLADKLRGSIDAAEYKHVVLGLIFLKYISDAFEARRQKLEAELKADGIEGKAAETLLESRDEYIYEVAAHCQQQNLIQLAPSGAKESSIRVHCS